MHIATKKYLRKNANKLCLMGQIVIESHSFLEYWQNHLIHVEGLTVLMRTDRRNKEWQEKYIE